MDLKTIETLRRRRASVHHKLIEVRETEVRAHERPGGTTGTLAAISLSAVAISSAWARLSNAHGPAMSASGNALPKVAAPILTVGLGLNDGVSITTPS